MWLLYALLASFMLGSRRSIEKDLSSKIDHHALAWLQQAFALPVIVLTLFLAPFYLPNELTAQFWGWMVVYVIFGSLDLFLYFKALSLADISYVAPLLTLVSVGNIVGAYFVLHQVPTLFGYIGAGLIMLGAFVVRKAKQAEVKQQRTNQLALWCVLGLVVIRAFYSNVEVFMLREANPTTFNFYSSVLTVPVILLIATQLRSKKRVGHDQYWPTLKKQVSKYKWALFIIGVTYTINMLATYQAKLLSPDAGYVATVKSAQVLPTVLVGVFFFKEKVNRMQWAGLASIFTGLICLSL